MSTEYLMGRNLVVMFVLPLPGRLVWTTATLGHTANSWYVLRIVAVKLRSSVFQWMHNDGLADFHKIKRQMLASIRDDVFNWVTGNTGWSCDK